MKPVIKFVNGQWDCTFKSFKGRGKTPEIAYERLIAKTKDYASIAERGKFPKVKRMMAEALEINNVQTVA